jgi:hypothetical protein
VTIFDKETNEALQQHSTSEVLYCSMADSTHFVYITSPRYGDPLCGGSFSLEDASITRLCWVEASTRAIKWHAFSPFSGA